MEYGGQCVMTTGMKEMLQLLADSWDLMTEVHRTTRIRITEPVLSHETYCIRQYMT